MRKFFRPTQLLPRYLFGFSFTAGGWVRVHLLTVDETFEREKKKKKTAKSSPRPRFFLSGPPPRLKGLPKLGGGFLAGAFRLCQRQGRR